MGKFKKFIYAHKVRWVALFTIASINLLLFQNCADQSQLDLSSIKQSSVVADNAPAAPLPAPTPSPGGTPTPLPPVQVPPVSSTNAALLNKLLNFAQTWKRNWNFGGHSVVICTASITANCFSTSQGYWEYAENIYEPWLFDRASVGYRLYLLTGDQQWLNQANSDFDWYVAHINTGGYFTPKVLGGESDTKYGYTTPFVLKGRANLTQQHLTVAQRIYEASVTGFDSVNSPTGGGMWTEREIGLALEAAVGYYELTSNASALTRAQALVDQWQTFSDLHGGAPLVTYTRHEGGGPGGTTPQDLVTSPWMSALYFQAARRYVAANPAAATQVYRQVSNYFDWLDNNGGFYDGSLAHPQYAGLVFPGYFAGLWLNGPIGDGGYDAAHMAHAIDVAGLVAYAVVAKQSLGLPTTRATLRLAQMRVTADRDIENLTRTTTYLPKYRVNPARKFNWQLRGMWELNALTSN